MWSLQSFLQAFSNRFIPLIAGMEDTLFKEDSEGSILDKKIGMKRIRFTDDVYNWQKYFWFIKGTSLFINLQTSGKTAVMMHTIDLHENSELFASFGY